jgi:hypothetical protein
MVALNGVFSFFFSKLGIIFLSLKNDVEEDA